MIVKRLSQLITRLTAYGHRPSQLFDDWLELVEASLTMLPAHAASVQSTGKMAEDTPEIQALWERMRNKHRPETFSGFAEATGLLLDASGRFSRELGSLNFPEAETAFSGPDILGNLYMELCATPHNGQFFTPWSIAKMMAMMTIPDGEEQVRSRLRQAFDKALSQTDEPVQSLLTAAVLTGAAIPQEGTDSLSYFLQYVWPHVAPFYEPITICDPAVGSGVMLLAASSQFPRWANISGMVRYYGQDIDATCVRMARINGILYGYGSPNAWAWSIAGFDTPRERAEIRAALPQTPEPLNGLYTRALEAAENGHTDALERLRVEAREMRQASLFDVS